jgi:hypothetical protein
VRARSRRWMEITRGRRRRFVEIPRLTIPAM